MVGKFFKRPELGFAALVSGHLAVAWRTIEGALEWTTLVLGVVIGILTVVRLLVELRASSGGRRSRRFRARRSRSL